MEPIQKKPFGMSAEFLLQVGAIIISMTIAYMAIDFRSKKTEADVLDLKKEQVTLRVQVRDVETQQVRLDERFTNIMTLLNRIDERLERAEARFK